MTLNVRIYDTEENAAAADAALAEAGFTERNVFLPSKLKGQEKTAVQSAIDNGALPERNILVCTRTLQDGRSLVSVHAPFGSGQAAINIMERIDGVDGDLLSRYVASDPAPFSNALGISVISRAEPATGLASSDWSLSSAFGLGLLSDKAAPLSSLFGMNTRSSSKQGWTKSFGLPLLSGKAAPLSSLFGMGTVVKPKRPWNWSLGLPLLSSKPAPLSSLLGMSTLFKDDK